MFRLFFDMDGVLCNFDKKVKDLKIKSTPNVPSEKLPDNLKTDRINFWKKIAEYKSNFWETIEPNEDTVDLVKFLRYHTKLEINVLSKLPSSDCVHDFSKEGKKKWLDQNFGKDFFDHIYLVDKNKEKYCTGPNDILIDDRADTCEKWRLVDGWAVEYKNTKQLKSAIEFIIKDEY